MQYFNRKDIVRILAEKPDMMSVFPEYVLSTRQRDEMAHIPGIALCDITMLQDTAALERLCKARCPDAILPAVVYTGVERVRWSECDTLVAMLKKKIGRVLPVHVLEPVVLGAPMLRSALCMYAAAQAQQHTCSALTCAACLFYRVAVCIPLCKQCGVNRIALAGIAPCCAPAVAVLQAPMLQKFCAILAGGYGMTLEMALAHGQAGGPVDDAQSAAALFECCARIPGPGGESGALAPPGNELLQRYFEQFAIPCAANIMSSLIAGRPVDFLAIARSFLPAHSTQ